MADRGGFVNVPGKGRRFRTPEGEYRYGAPGDVTAGIIPRIEKFFGRLFAPRGTDRFTPAEMNALLPRRKIMRLAANAKALTFLTAFLMPRQHRFFLQTQPLEEAVVSLNSRRNP
jgi:hypothetical protein